MKFSAALITTLLLFSCAYSQVTWCPPGATWWFSYGDVLSSGFIRITYTGDQMVNGKMCQMLEKKRVVYGELIGGIGFDSTVIGTAATFVQNDSIFYFDDDGDAYLLYDFSAQVEDVWEVAAKNPFCTDSLAKVRVDSIGTTNINGMLLRLVDVDPLPESYFAIRGEVIERIGSHEFYMFPDYISCLIDGNEGGPFRCYQDDDFGFYQKPGAPPCDFIVGLPEHFQDNRMVELFPNPASILLNINIEDERNQSYQLQILSTTGIMLKELTIQGSSNAIDISELPSGVYSILIGDQDHWIQRQFIKTK